MNKKDSIKRKGQRLGYVHDAIEKCREDFDISYENTDIDVARVLQWESQSREEKRKKHVEMFGETAVASGMLWKCMA